MYQKFFPMDFGCFTFWPNFSLGCVCVSFHWRITALQSSGDLPAVHQHKSVTIINIPSFLGLPSASSHTFKVLIEHQACLPVLYSRLNVQCCFLRICLHPLLPCCAHQIISLYLCLHLFSVITFFSTIFLGSIYMH